MIIERDHFCLAIPNFQSESGANEEGIAHCSPPGKLAMMETHSEFSPTVIESSLGLFAENVSTSLPYRLIRSREAYPFAAVMIDEDCIMAQILEQTV